MSIFFFGKVGKLVQANILGSKKLPLLIENIVSTFVEDQWLYKNEIYLEDPCKIFGAHFM
jgi:hypothetical protein